MLQPLYETGSTKAWKLSIAKFNILFTKFEFWSNVQYGLQALASSAYMSASGDEGAVPNGRVAVEEYVFGACYTYTVFCRQYKRTK